MSKIETGGPAFARAAFVNRASGVTCWEQDGMTLRDYFAALAAIGGWLSEVGEFEKAADFAYRMADAMIERRKT